MKRVKKIGVILVSKSPSPHHRITFNKLQTQGVEDLQWKGFSDLRVCLNEISHFQDVKQQRPADW